MTPDPVAQTLLDRFGFDSFRAGQREAIDALLNEGASLAVFPTGGGKSLCYQLPALLIEGLTVVVSPLLALMKDQIDFLVRRNIPAARLDSSMTADEVRAVTQRIRAGELKLLYVAPERFNNERFLTELAHTDIGLFAVDEAHCISEWGHNFRPDYLKLAETARTLGVKRVLALTATATPTVVRDICQAFNIPDSGVALTGFYRPNLNLITTPCLPNERIGKLVERLRKRPPGATIVYVTLQKTAEQVAARLIAEGFDAQAYHAGMESDERTKTQDWWMNHPGAIVVATIAFGMGIDKADVRYVYHYNLPKSLESYSQEIGRAGRDDRSSTVELLACGADLPTLANFVYGDTPEPSSLRSLVHELLCGPEVIDIAPRECGDRHDLRALVLRTSLTYLELEGALRKGTPFYAGYEFKPLRGISAVLSEFEGNPGEFVQAIVSACRKGRTWYGVDPEVMAGQLATSRGRILKALEVLAERGLIELRASDLRDRYHRLMEADQAHRLATLLSERFEAREKAEIKRLAMVPDLVQASECQTNRLVGYFGQVRNEPCGHCSFCRTGVAVQIPTVELTETLEQLISVNQLAELVDAHPTALGSPRSRAKFLCGLTGPWISKARLNKHSLFGIAEAFPFEDVLRFVSYDSARVS